MRLFGAVTGREASLTVRVEGGGQGGTVREVHQGECTQSGEFIT